MICVFLCVWSFLFVCEFSCSVFSGETQDKLLLHHNDTILLCVVDSLSVHARVCVARSLLSILMGFSSACQAKAQSKVVEDVDSVAAWTSNLIFQVFRLVSRVWGLLLY